MHIVWFNNISGSEEIFYKRSLDGGITWENEIRMTNAAVFSDNPSIAVSGNDIHLVWQSNRDGNFDIYHGYSNDGGTTWAPAERLTFADGASYNPSVFCSGLDLHCVWYDTRDGNYEIYYKRSTDSGTSWEDDFRLTDDPASSAFPFIAGTDSALHVMWQDFRDGNPEIYYKRFLVENPGTGIRNLSTNPAKAFSLGQNHPNPCSSLTRIKFQVPGAGNVNITLYDLFGKEVATLFNENLLPGTYEITFDASGLTHGIYYYCLKTGNSTETKILIQM